jgi:hypothetical protein
LPCERRLAPWVSAAVLEDISLFLGEIFLMRRRPPVQHGRTHAQATNLTNHDLKGVYNMNTRFLNIAFLVSALAVFSLAADAQSVVAKATVPFEFAAGGAMLPPGEYTVDVPISGVIVLHGSAGNSVALLTVSSGLATPSNTSKLLFERRDGMAFLSGVEWPNQSVRLMSPFARILKGAATALLH